MTDYADKLYPNGCSCGINYIDLGMTYYDHLIKEHMVKIKGDKKNG